MECGDCKQDHRHQIEDYPVGARVVVIGAFDDKPLGALGEVTDHCDDGRAVIVFPDDSVSHTFHWIADYLAVGKERII